MSDKVLEIGMNALKAQGKLPLSVIGTDYAQISIAISLQRIADALEKFTAYPPLVFDRTMAEDLRGIQALKDEIARQKKTRSYGGTG